GAASCRAIMRRTAIQTIRSTTSVLCAGSSGGVSSTSRVLPGPIQSITGTSTTIRDPTIVGTCGGPVKKTVVDWDFHRPRKGNPLRQETPMGRAGHEVVEAAYSWFASGHDFCM